MVIEDSTQTSISEDPSTISSSETSFNSKFENIIELEPQKHSTLASRKYPGKERKSRQFLGTLDGSTSSLFSADSDPKSVSEALSEPQKDKWKHAMKEYNAMKNKQVWDLVTLPEGQKSVKSMWV